MKQVNILNRRSIKKKSPIVPRMEHSSKTTSPMPNPSAPNESGGFGSTGASAVPPGQHSDASWGKAREDHNSVHACESVNDSRQEASSAMAPVTLACPLRIISALDVERFSRIGIEKNTKRSANFLRVALKASLTYGNEWFPVREVLTTLPGVSPDAYHTDGVVKQLTEYGIAECKLTNAGSYFRHDARLKCKLVDVTHFYGKCSLRLHQDLDAYHAVHPRASPLAALTLLAINLFHIHDSSEIRKFLEPEFDTDRNKSMSGKLLNKLAAIKLLVIYRQSQSLSRPFLVIPVSQ